jgi:hypothetical protein
MSMMDDPTRRPPQQQQGGADPSFLWIDQFSEELLLTVQAFQRLHAALQARMLGP